MNNTLLLQKFQASLEDAKHSRFKEQILLLAFQELLRGVVKARKTDELDVFQCFMTVHGMLEKMAASLGAEGITLYGCRQKEGKLFLPRLFFHNPHMKGGDIDKVCSALDQPMEADFNSFVGTAVLYLKNRPPKEADVTRPTHLFILENPPEFIGGSDVIFWEVENVYDPKLPNGLRKKVDSLHDDKSSFHPGSMLIVVILLDGEPVLVFQLIRKAIVVQNQKENGEVEFQAIPFTQTEQELFLSMIVAIKDFFIDNLAHLTHSPLVCEFPQSQAAAEQPEVPPSDAASQAQLALVPPPTQHVDPDGVEYLLRNQGIAPSPVPMEIFPVVAGSSSYENRLEGFSKVARAFGSSDNQVLATINGMETFMKLPFHLMV